MKNAPAFTDAHRLLVLATAIVGQNVATGLTIGAYGVLIPSLVSTMAGSTAAASSGIALVFLAMGLTAPLIGPAIRLTSMRFVMLAGAALLTGGHLLLAGAPNTVAFLFIYALLIGPGVCALGPVLITTLINEWFDAKRGIALGLATMPIGALIAPLLVAGAVERFGLPATYFAFALLSAAIIPLILLLPRPAQTRRPISLGKSWRDANRNYSLVGAVSVGLGFLVAPGVMAMAHIVPIGLRFGLSMQAASLLLSLLAGSGVLGALAFGWMADKVGPIATLVANSLLQIFGWILVLLAPHAALLLLPAALLGFCGGGVMPAFGAMIGKAFARDEVASVMGIASLIAVPFTFSAAPIAGLWVDASGNYDAAICTNIAMLLVSATLFYFLVRPFLPRREAA